MVHRLMLGSGRHMLADDHGEPLMVIDSITTTTGVLIATDRPTAD